MASKSHRFCKGRKRVHVLYIERKKNLVLDTARIGGKQDSDDKSSIPPQYWDKGWGQKYFFFTGENWKFEGEDCD